MCAAGAFRELLSHARTMLPCLLAASGLVNTYPVSSFNLSVAQSTDGAPHWFEAVDSISKTIGVDDAASGYGVATCPTGVSYSLGGGKRRRRPLTTMR